MPDPYAFTDKNEMGDVCSPDVPVPMDVWRYVVHPTTKERNGSSVKREKFLTIGEVYKNLKVRLDVIVCPACKFERPRKREDCLAPCDKCGTETYWLIDEYFSICHGMERGLCGPFDRVICWACTGGSEGHYFHVEGVKDGRLIGLFIGKTWRGMDGALEFVRRINELLGL